MLMVIAYHCLCYYGIWSNSPIINYYYIGLGKFINSIDMPIFFILSGFLYSSKLNENHNTTNTIPFIRKKIKRLLIPYIIWGIAINLMFSDQYQFKYIFTGISHLWFLLTLMMIFIITHSTRKWWLNISISSLYGATVILLLMAPLNDLIYINLLTLSRTLQYLPYFFIGIIFSRYYSKSPIHPHKYSIIILVITCISSLLLCTIDTDDYIIRAISKYIVIPLFSIIIISISWILCQQINFKDTAIIHSLDQNSMGIYIIHHILIVAATSNNSLSTLFITHYIGAPIILFISSLSISWIISILINNSKFRFILG